MDFFAPITNAFNSFASMFTSSRSTDTCKEPDGCVTLEAGEEKSVTCCICDKDVRLCDVGLSVVFDFGEEHWCSECTTRMSPEQIQKLLDRFETPIHEPGKDDKPGERERQPE